MDELYEKFLSRENFELAYSRIKHWPKNAYKFFYKTDIEAFEVFLSNNIEQLISEIQDITGNTFIFFKLWITQAIYIT